MPVSQTKTSIQGTAPPAPNPGDLWFDGTQLHIWDGTTWELVGPGATVGPVPTSAKVLEVKSPTGSNVTAGTWAILPISGTPNINTFGTWDVSTKIYKPNKAGIYNFELLQYNSNTGILAMALLLNDSGGPYGSTIINAPVALLCEETGTGWVQSSGMVVMNGTTDFVRVWVIVTGATAIDQSYNLPTLRAFLLA